MEPELGDEAEKTAGLEVDPLERAHRCAEAAVELERIARVGEERELLDRLGQRLDDRFPGEGFEGRRQRPRRGGRPPPSGATSPVSLASPSAAIASAARQAGIRAPDMRLASSVA